MAKSAVPAQLQMPVVQIKQSHDLALCTADVGQDGGIAVVPVFNEMRAGDNLTLRWQGFYGGQPDDEWTFTCPLDDLAIEQPLVILIPKSVINFSQEAEVSYQLARSSDGSVIDSPVQTFVIRAPVAQRLLAPAIESHDASQPIDPGLFPQGIVVQIVDYSGMQAGDDVLLYADGAPDDGSLVMSLRVPQNFRQTDGLQFSIGQPWLLLNQGQPVRLTYQYARPGAAMSSEPLVFQVLEPLDLPAPIVERAQAEGGADEHKGFLLASAAISGVYIKVPESVPLEAGDQLEVHWQGDPAGGQHVATSAANSQDPRLIFIPATAVAANMGGENKRFAVYYRLMPLSGTSYDSQPFRLRVQPLPQHQYPMIQWTRGTSTLSLKTVPANGEEWRLAKWPFLAQGQLLTVEATGVTPAETAAHTVVRAALPLTPQEAIAPYVLGRLSLIFLRTLKLNTAITLKVQVSFDGGKTPTYFPSNGGITLVE